MAFISPEFLIFFAVVVALYYALPARLRWLFLLAASGVFYLAGGVGPFVLLVAAILVNFGAGLLLARIERRRRLVLALTVLFNLGLLLVFKYADFFNASLMDLSDSLGMSYQAEKFNLVLPLGLSFYTFQLIAYVVDVYKRKIAPERHLGLFANYVAFFPKMVAGPIERPDHLLPQFRARVHFDEAGAVEGLRRILWGVFKKVAIADRLGIYVGAVFNNLDTYTGAPLILASLLFTFQIYCDFSAYSDIAIGVARILGFDLVENFRQPYLSRSIREFWRRWHISLSSWFRDYLYFPLGGSRVPLVRVLLNLMIVFVVSGLWHGASWTFAIWGALHGGYLIVETLWQRWTTRPRLPFNPAVIALLQTLLTFALVWFAWIYFRADSLDNAAYVVQHLFDLSGGLDFEKVLHPFKDALFPQEIEFALAFALIVLLVAADWIDSRVGLLNAIAARPAPLRWAIYYLLALAIGVSLWAAADSTQNFIYARF